MASQPFKMSLSRRGKTPITRLYSAASVGKTVLRSLGIRPLFEQQPDLELTKPGPWMSAYFGGRADVRVRRVEVPVRVVDFTSMYPTIFIAQDLQRLLAAQRYDFVDRTAQVRKLLESITLDDLFDPNVWPQLNCLVKIKPSGEILPVRFKLRPDHPWQIAVTRFTASHDAFYALADCIAAKILGGAAPYVLEAVEVVPRGSQEGLSVIGFRGTVRIDPRGQIFKSIVEQRYTARADGNRRLEASLKELANSAAYGVNAEINTQPPRRRQAGQGRVYGAWTFTSRDIADERPGEYFNAIIACLVTAGARLRLGMLERMVADRGGTYAFCDTDSLAIVSGKNCPTAAPHITRADVLDIIERFNSLNPYDRGIVPQILRLQYDDVRCFAISAKRYVLFTRDKKGFPNIVKASESGLGALIDQHTPDDPKSLIQQVWQLILAEADGRPFDSRHLRVPARRRVPLNRPSLLVPFANYNRGRTFENQIKPFGFLQTFTPAIECGQKVRPLAPFTKTLAEARKVPWIDLESGREIHPDWSGSNLSGTIPPQTVLELARQYARHPEQKAADAHGHPCDAGAVGCLYRLHIVGSTPVHLGKEIDRLDEDEGLVLGEQGELEDAMLALVQLPLAEVAQQVGISARRYRDIQRRRAQPRPFTRQAILNLARSLRQH
jgi:hypothetical protein